ncbi:MAG: hypothetical protein OZ948_07940 [Deltaproteobacteria bacterium]|nr:hypothetical protein [Deltaproteobacteria bacterium]
MPERSIDAPRRAEWERIRRTGVWPYAIRRGLARGIPMGIVIIVLLELVQGRSFGPALFRDPAVLGRFALAIVLFSLGGVVSTYARWRALDLRFGDAGKE